MVYLYLFFLSYQKCITIDLKFLKLFIRKVSIFLKKDSLFFQHILFLYVCKQTFWLWKMRTCQKLKVIMI